LGIDEPIRITTPISEETVRSLKAGDRVLLSGVVYTGRDAAHKRLYELLQSGKELPVDLRGQVIYYVGPAPAKPGQVIGSAGPTTSGRMDAYAPALISYGLRGMIGKGLRSPAVTEAMAEHGAVYFAATGGAAALLARRVVSCEVVAYEDLGTEAIRRLVVEDLPLIVANDASGGDFYREGVKAYERSRGSSR
jgi:fumarate hydratase subunit beta